MMAFRMTEPLPIPISGTPSWLLYSLIFLIFVIVGAHHQRAFENDVFSDELRIPTIEFAILAPFRIDPSAMIEFADLAFFDSRRRKKSSTRVNRRRHIVEIEVGRRCS